MEPEIVTIAERILIGKRLTMSFAENRTPELWRSFMPQRKSIDSVNDELFSVALYSADFFNAFDPAAPFEKWAAMQISSLQNATENMETLTIPAGRYAVFHYKGSSDDAAKIFDYIFNNWLPRSGYKLDKRPHFEILGERYKNGDPESEEDIYIPIKPIE